MFYEFKLMDKKELQQLDRILTLEINKIDGCEYVREEYNIIKDKTIIKMINFEDLMNDYWNKYDLKDEISIDFIESKLIKDKNVFTINEYLDKLYEKTTPRVKSLVLEQKGHGERNGYDSVYSLVRLDKELHEFLDQNNITIR